MRRWPHEVALVWLGTAQGSGQCSGNWITYGGPEQISKYIQKSAFSVIEKEVTNRRSVEGILSCWIIIEGIGGNSQY